MIIGERSNGKTFAALEYIIKEYAENKRQGAILRRFKEDVVGKRAASMFADTALVEKVAKYTNEEFTSIHYTSGRFYFCYYDEDNKRVLDTEPFCFAFALSDMEHDKSLSFPNVKTIVFDEFITRFAYLYGEFQIFMNCISTIVRQRDDVRIIMLGNTVDKNCPYFKEFGLYNIYNQKQGTIDIYNVGESGLKIAVEYVAEGTAKASNVYFSFNNPHLQMIKKGTWEMDIYPHLLTKYKPSDIQFIYFIIFNDTTLQCEVIMKDDSLFTYIHRKTTPIQNEDDVVFTLEDSIKPNVFKYINKPILPIHKKIYSFYTMNKVFYQDNEVGEIVHKYMTMKPF